MSACAVCGIPADAGYFDSSTVVDGIDAGAEVVLARYQLHRNYCGVLLHFAQLADGQGIRTPDLVWQIRCDGHPRDPYLSFDHIINPWGSSPVPVALRLEEGALVELVVRNRGASRRTSIGGRLVGRYWYDTRYGDARDRL
jgi:hypothetical protein